MREVFWSKGMRIYLLGKFANRYMGFSLSKSNRPKYVSFYINGESKVSFVYSMNRRVVAKSLKIPENQLLKYTFSTLQKFEIKFSL